MALSLSNGTRARPQHGDASAVNEAPWGGHVADHDEIHSKTNLIFSGAGTPEAAVTAPIGSLFLRTDGGAATTLYVKETGAGNTGWVGK